MPAFPGPENSAPAPDPLADDRGLWDLLDHAPRPPVTGPYFSRRVLRAVANYEEERAVPAWRRLARLFATRPRAAWSGASFAGIAAAMILAMGTFGLWSGPHRRLHPAATVEGGATGGNPAATPRESVIQEGDVGVIANLDELTDSNENHVWLDEDDENAS